MVKKNELHSLFLERIKGRILKCKRCGYIWIQKSKRKKPKNCPKCNSPYWMKERLKKLTFEMIKGIKF